MKWFIIVTFLQAPVPNTDMNNMYVFSQPYFETQKECFDYVQVKNLDIYNMAAGSYNYRYRPEAIYCMDTKGLNVLLEEYRNFINEEQKKGKLSS